MEIRAAYIPENCGNHYLLKLFNVEVPPSVRTYREHQHIHFEMTLFQDGAGTYATSRTTYPIEPGDVFIYASNEVHCITEITRPLRLMNVHFEPQFLWSGHSTLAPASEMLCFTHSDRFQNRLPRDHEATARIRQLLKETEQEMERRAPEHELMVRMKLSEIFVHLQRSLHYADGLPDNPTLRRHLTAVNCAMDYVAEHIAEPLTLQDIAAQVQMSPSYFSAVFRQIHSVPLWDYVAEKRIALAMRLLDQGGLSMMEVALQSGFNNTANFNKTFLRCAGLTPSEYRRHGCAVLY